MRKKEEWVEASKNVIARILGELETDCPERKNVWQLVVELRSKINEKGRDSTVSMDILFDCRDPEMESSSEQAFRRGYVHGYVHALDDDDKTIQQRNSHVDALMEWRYGDCSRMFTAPVIEKAN